MKDPLIPDTLFNDEKIYNHYYQPAVFYPAVIRAGAGDFVLFMAALFLHVEHGGF